MKKKIDMYSCALPTMQIYRLETWQGKKEADMTGSILKEKSHKDKCSQSKLNGESCVDTLV